MKALTYLIYIVLWEGMVFGGTGYVVFVLDRSGWWFALALMIGSCAYKPETWIHGKAPNALAQADAACGVSPGAMGSASLVEQGEKR